MANTYILIASNTVGSGGAASIDFNSIPATYTDLVIFLSARSNIAQTINGVFLKFNNTSESTNWTRRQVEGGDGTVTSSTSTTAIAGYANGNSATANTFSNHFIYIPNYTSSNYKSVSIDTVAEGNAANGYYVDLIEQLWSNTAAINQVTLVSNSSDFMQYTTAYLYGIKNS
jgi:hypothetical protein